MGWGIHSRERTDKSQAAVRREVTWSGHRPLGVAASYWSAGPLFHRLFLSIFPLPLNARGSFSCSSPYSNGDNDDLPSITPNRHPSASRSPLLASIVYPPAVTTTMIQPRWLGSGPHSLGQENRRPNGMQMLSMGHAVAH